MEHIIRIKSSDITSQEIKRLSSFKEWVCKVLKIKPARYYYFRAKIELSLSGSVSKTDILRSEDGVDWHVTEVRGFMVKLISVKGEQRAEIGSYMYHIASIHSEN